MMMESQLESLLSGLHQWGREHDEVQPELARKMLNLQPDTALLISILVRSSRRQRMLELGTSNGYSTIWLASAARELGGQVTSVDHSAAKLAQADVNLHRANLRQFVDLRLGDAAAVIDTLSGPFDFVFFDSVQMKPWIPLQRVWPKLSADAFVLADNVLSHPVEMQPFLSAVAAQAGFDHVVVPVGKGLFVAYRSANRCAA